MKTFPIHLAHTGIAGALRSQTMCFEFLLFPFSFSLFSFLCVCVEADLINSTNGTEVSESWNFLEFEPRKT